METAEQLDRLRKEGCSEIQGYLTGRPMPAPRLPAWMASDPASPAAGKPPSDAKTRADRAA